MAGLPFIFFGLLTSSQYSDTLLSGDGHWENIFCERKATQWPSRSWTWNFHPAVRADQEYQLWYSEALVNRKDGDNGLECVAAYGLYVWAMVKESRSRPLDWSITQNCYCKLSLTKMNLIIFLHRYKRGCWLWLRINSCKCFCYENKHQNQKHRKYSSLNDVTLLGLQLKKTDKVVLKIEEPTLNINFQ